jgi:nucleotide-binding universal stress UspA family protein
VGGAQKYLREAAESVRSAHPEANVTWEVGTAGDVAEYLVTLLQPSYTLLAMATHGRTGIIRWVWGSITERVVQQTRLPLLLVRPAQPAGQTDLPQKGS